MKSTRDYLINSHMGGKHDAGQLKHYTDGPTNHRDDAIDNPRQLPQLARDPNALNTPPQTTKSDRAQQGMRGCNEQGIICKMVNSIQQTPNAWKMWRIPKHPSNR